MVLIVVYEFKLIAASLEVKLDLAVAIGAVNGISRFLISVKEKVRVADGAGIFLFHYGTSFFPGEVSEKTIYQ
jgi:hypothetical protein